MIKSIPSISAAQEIDGQLPVTSDTQLEGKPGSAVETISLRETCTLSTAFCLFVVSLCLTAITINQCRHNKKLRKEVYLLKIKQPIPPPGYWNNLYDGSLSPVNSQYAPLVSTMSHVYENVPPVANLYETISLTEKVRKY